MSALLNIPVSLYLCISLFTLLNTHITPVTTIYRADINAITRYIHICKQRNLESGIIIQNRQSIVLPPEARQRACQETSRISLCFASGAAVTKERFEVIKCPITETRETRSVHVWNCSEHITIRPGMICPTVLLTRPSWRRSTKIRNVSLYFSDSQLVFCKSRKRTHKGSAVFHLKISKQHLR